MPAQMKSSNLKYRTVTYGPSDEDSDEEMLHYKFFQLPGGAVIPMFGKDWQALKEKMAESVKF